MKFDQSRQPICQSYPPTDQCDFSSSGLMQLNERTLYYYPHPEVNPLLTVAVTYFLFAPQVQLTRFVVQAYDENWRHLAVVQNKVEVGSQAVFS